MSNEAVIRLSAFDPPIEEQLKMQGYGFIGYGKASGYEVLRRSLIELYSHGMLSVADRDKVGAKIIKSIHKDIRRF